MAEWIIAGLLVLGGTFGLIGSFGLLRLSHPMQRLHAPTKASTLGLWAVLLASIAHAWVFDGRFSGHEALVVLFLLVTAPITANFLAKVHMHQEASDVDLPPTGTGRPWATYAGATGPNPDEPPKS